MKAAAVQEFWCAHSETHSDAMEAPRRIVTREVSQLRSDPTRYPVAVPADMRLDTPVINITGKTSLRLGEKYVVVVMEAGEFERLKDL